jgi:Peptidase family M23
MEYYRFLIYARGLLYAHLQNRQAVSVNQQVTNSTIIGYMGNSGNSDGAHLHFQVEDTAQTINTNNFVKGGHYFYALPVNPNNFFANTTGNVSSQSEIDSCSSSSIGGNSTFPANPEEDRYLGSESDKFDKEANEAIVDILIKKDGSRSIIKNTIPKPIITYLNYDEANKVTAYGKSVLGKGLESGLNPRFYIYQENTDQVCTEYSTKVLWWGGECKKTTQAQPTRIAEFNQELSDVKLYLDKISGSNTDWSIGQINPLTNDPNLKESINGKEYQTQTKNRFKVSLDNKNISIDDYLRTRTNIGFSLKGDKYDINFTSEQNQIWGDSNKVKNFVQALEASGVVKLGDDTKDVQLVVKSRGGLLPEQMDRYRNQNIWIVSHGMNNTHNDLNIISEALMQIYPNDTIIALDWRGSQVPWTGAGISPNETDQWIRITAKWAMKKLTRWGVNNTSKINTIGHSMGSIMSAEITKQFNQYGETNNMILLDPPSYFKTNTQFDVDDNDGWKDDSIYGDNNGYSKAKSRISKAFTGLGIDYANNMCGNLKLAKTAKETYTFYMPEASSIIGGNGFCEIHGGVNKVYADIIRNKFGSLNINNFINQTDSNNTIIYDHTGLKANVVVRGNDYAQEIMVSNGNNYNVFGRDGENTFRNPDHNNNQKNKMHIINKLENNDKISLTQQSEGSTKSIQDYKIQSRTTVLAGPGSPSKTTSVITKSFCNVAVGGRVDCVDKDNIIFDTSDVNIDTLKSDLEKLKRNEDLDKIRFIKR